MVLQHLDLLRKKRILLASASPRRWEILTGIGLHNVERCVSSFAEDLPKADFKCGGDYALCTARRKAECVVEQQRQEDSGAQLPFDVLLAADTVVTMPMLEGGIIIMEKPTTSEEAAAMMRHLSGTRHDVWSGVVLVVREKAKTGGGEELHWREIKVRTTVEFAPLVEEEIAAYVADSSNWTGKAGGYGIQDIAACLIVAIDGDYYNVMGLPLRSLCAEIDRFIHDGILR